MHKLKVVVKGKEREYSIVEPRIIKKEPIINDTWWKELIEVGLKKNKLKQ